MTIKDIKVLETIKEGKTIYQSSRERCFNCCPDGAVRDRVLANSGDQFNSPNCSIP